MAEVRRQTDESEREKKLHEEIESTKVRLQDC